MSLRDVLARITRAREALLDGDRALLEQLLEDLEADVWRAIEQDERRRDAA